MFWLSFVLLVLLGLLGIAGWLKQRQPSAGEPLGQLEAVGGWIGLFGLLWGLFLLIRALSWIGTMLRYAAGHWIVLVLTALIIIALSLVLAAPTLRALAGSNGFTSAVDRMAAKLAPHRAALGATCLVLAAWSLFNYLF